MLPPRHAYGTPSPPPQPTSRVYGTAAVAPVAISCTSLPRCMQMQALILEDNGARARRRDVPFERMKVVQLKEELAVRGSTRTGLKMVLQRRLHAMLMQSAIEHQAREVED